MMVQPAPKGEPHFLCSMREHNALCGQFVRAFGNQQFERCEPFKEMVYVVSHHDNGWDEFDAAPELDPKTGLPCGIGASAPASGSGITGRRSAEVNEDHDPYCGLMASMHSWGLYNARYGYTEFRVRQGGSTSIPTPDAGPVRERVLDMLSGEIERQNRLKDEVAGNGERRDWVDEAHVVQNYKQLQFFDTLALYFHLRHQDERAEEVFINVPISAERDAMVTVTPKGDGVYALDPFPFAGDRLEVTCSGRYLTPYGEGEAPDDLAAALDALPAASQTYTLLRG